RRVVRAGRTRSTARGGLKIGSGARVHDDWVSVDVTHPRVSGPTNTVRCWSAPRSSVLGSVRVRRSEVGVAVDGVGVVVQFASSGGATVPGRRGPLQETSGGIGVGVPSGRRDI